MQFRITAAIPRYESRRHSSFAHSQKVPSSVKYEIVNSDRAEQHTIISVVNSAFSMASTAVVKLLMRSSSLPASAISYRK